MPKGPLFRALIKQAAQEWKDLPLADREAIRQEASTLRLRRELVGHPLRQFLEEATKDEFPISEKDAADVLDSDAGVYNKAEMWKKRTGEEVQPDSSFPSAIHCERACLEYLPDCYDKIQPEHLQHMEGIVESLRLIFAHREGKTDKEVPECKLVLAQSCGTGLLARELIAIECCSARKNPFAAEFLEYDIEGLALFGVDDLASAALPISIVLRCHEQPGGLLPTMYTESSLAHSLVQKSYNWEYFECTYGVASLIPDPATGVPDLSRLAIRSMQKINLHAMVDMCVGTQGPLPKALIYGL